MKPQKKRSNILIKWFFTGVAVFAPLGITIWFSYYIINITDKLFNLIFPAKYNINEYVLTHYGYKVPGMGILFLFVIAILLGSFSQIFLGKWIFSFLDNIMNKMPVLKSIYKTIRQLTNTFMGENGTSAFKETCLIQFPLENMWAIAFITGKPSGQIKDISDDNLIYVYVPTTPNPTSGYLLVVKEADIFRLELNPEDALKLIISGGLVSPENLIKQYPQYDENENIITN